MKIKTRQSNINTYYDYVYIKNGLININNTIDLFNRLIDDDDIPFDEYVDIINRVYNVEITNNDLLRISSIILGDTSKSILLNTDMMYDFIKQTEVNSYFEYFEEQRKLYLKVAFIDDKDINFNHNYTTTEINKLIQDKKIVLLEFVLDEEDDMAFYEEDEINGLYPINNITLDHFTDIKYIQEDYITSVFIYLKSYFTIDRLKTDLNDYIDKTKIKLQVLEKYITGIQSNRFSRVKIFDDILVELRKIRKRKISDEL